MMTLLVVAFAWIVVGLQTSGRAPFGVFRFAWSRRRRDMRGGQLGHSHRQSPCNARRRRRRGPWRDRDGACVFSPRIRRGLGTTMGRIRLYRSFAVTTRHWDSIHFVQKSAIEAPAHGDERTPPRYMYWIIDLALVWPRDLARRSSQSPPSRIRSIVALYACVNSRAATSNSYTILGFGRASSCRRR